MRAYKLREKTERELEEERLKLRGELFELVLRKRREGLEDTSDLKKKRRDTARLMTVMREKEIIRDFRDKETPR